MTRFAHHAVFLFLALRAGDIVNLAAGLWFVPKFIAPNDLGAVLPVTTFATILSLPIFAFGMSVMKESADLARQNARAQLKDLWRGVFIAVAAFSLLSLTLAYAFLPRYFVRVGVDSRTSMLVFVAAVLGAVAPVYTDALQSVKRFRALGFVEILSAVSRFAALLLLMPLRPFAGYFAGNALQPLVRIVASVFALRRDLSVPAQRWWTRSHAIRLFARFALVLVYMAVPMFVSGLEQDALRHGLSTTDSAAYFVLTRFSDILNYLTFPLLLVLFPYAADTADEGRATRSLVLRCSAVTLLAALVLGVGYSFFGSSLLALMPNGTAYANRLPCLSLLLATTALMACRTFLTNAEVAAGRFSFLGWILPVDGAYGVFLCVFPAATFVQMVTLFFLGALVRTVVGFLIYYHQFVPDFSSAGRASHF